MKTVAIVQARMGSSRLPGKVLADIAGTPMLDRIIERTAAARTIDRVVVATTDAGDDDALVDHLRQRGRDVYRGSVNDVLERFVGCARESRADVVVRVTADDPLKDPRIIDHAVGLLLSDPSLDYCSNTMAPTYPEGLDIEVARAAALERAHREAKLPSEREHVTPYLYRHLELFKVLNFTYERDLSDWRWTVDKPEDLEFVRRIFEHFRATPLVDYRDVIAWLDLNPDVRLIARRTARNEGYYQSLQVEQNHDQ